jgi:hypothetical protein
MNKELYNTMLLTTDEEDVTLGGILASAAAMLQDAEYLLEEDIISFERFKQIKTAVADDLEFELGLEFDE